MRTRKFSGRRSKADDDHLVSASSNQLPLTIHKPGLTLALLGDEDNVFHSNTERPRTSHTEHLESGQLSRISSAGRLISRPSRLSTSPTPPMISPVPGLGRNPFERRELSPPSSPSNRVLPPVRHPASMGSSSNLTQNTLYAPLDEDQFMPSVEKKKAHHHTGIRLTGLADDAESNFRKKPSGRK